MRLLALVATFFAAVAHAQLDPNLVPECIAQCSIQAAAAAGCTNGPLDSQCVCKDKSSAFTNAAIGCILKSGCNLSDALKFQGLQCNVPVEDSIICNAPYAMCNGYCTDPRIQPCSSAGARRRSMPTCLPGETICRLDRFVSQGGRREFGLGSGGGAYECIDIRSNLEACGGCPGDGGVDCTALYGVSDVECTKGRCVVSACNKGLSLVNGRCK